MTKEINAHRYRFEPPDMAHIDLSGDLSEVETRELFRLLAVDARDHGKLYIIVNATRLGAVSRETRHVGSLPDDSQSFAAIVFFGATFAQRTIFSLVDKAYRLLTRDPATAPMVFLRSADEAERWIAVHRKN